MKRQYLQTLPKPTNIKNEAYNAYLADVQKIFAQIVQKYDRESCQYLVEAIKKLKDVKEIKKIHKKQIYEFFLKRELETLDYIKGADSIDTKIMKLTKCKLDNFKLDWKQIWQRIVRQVPQTSLTNSKLIQGFLKHIKVFFDQNNALEVWKYFQIRNFKQMSKIVFNFVKITPQTKQDIFNEFIKLIVKNCEVKKLSSNDFLSLFLWVQKNRKQLVLPKQVIAFVNDKVIQFILANGEAAGSKKSSVQSKFGSVSAELLQRTLGKANPRSVQLLQTIFSFLKKFIKPLENSTKSVMFIYWLFKNIFQRVQKQKKTREKLAKLIDVMQKKKSEQQQQQTDGALGEKTQQQKNKKQKQKQKQDEQNDDDEQQQDQQDAQNEDEQMQQLLLTGSQSQLALDKDDDEHNQKGDTNQQKKQKMQRILANQLTDDILRCLQKQIQQIFEILYFVNSKKTISHLLRYIYRLFPKFVIKSLDILDKAATIQNINQDGLVKNLIVTVQHMFMSYNYKQGIKNVMRVLQKAYNSRRIVDVWYIYESLGSKIPLLDQKDLQKISEEDKLLFQNTFGLNHDRFYEQYSDHMVQAFKRLLREGQYLQKSQYKSYGTTLQQTYFNSYPFMRKRILQQVMEVLIDKPNSLAFLYFIFAQLPQRQFEILKNQLESMNDQNLYTEQLRLQMIGVLSKNMTLQQLKPYIRKMAQKGHFKVIEDYAMHKTVQQIKWEPYKTTLNYLYENPKITIQFEIPTQERKKNLAQLRDYRDELINEAIKQIQNIKQDQVDTVCNRIIKSYTTPAKISTLKTRKKLYQILSIVAIINSMMQQKIIEIKNNKKLQLVDSGVAPYQFLNTQKPFSKHIKKLLNSQQVLHDPKLIGTLNILLTGQYFMYHDIQAYEQKRRIRERKKNKNHQAPDCVNRMIYGDEYISTARAYMGLLLHRTHGGVNYNIKGKADQLFILSMINSNQTYKDIRSMFQQAQMIPKFRQQVFDLMRKKTQNRQLIRRISSTIDFLTKSQVSYIPYSDQQILQFVSYHTTLMQANDSKVKQNAIKSFRKFRILIIDNPISDKLTDALLKYKNTDKMEMIWIIYVASVLTHPNFKDQKQLAEKRILYFLNHMQKLLLHQSRSVRRICLYLYAALIRILKKMNTKYQVKNYQIGPNQHKSLQQFIQNGYLRPQFENKDLKDRSAHKHHPFETYQIKILFQVPDNLFQILTQNPDNAKKFIKNFHSDLASTAEMLLSAMQNAMVTVDLFNIATKSIEKLIYFFKTKDMTTSKNQMLVGGKFFKYLCIQDAKKCYKFFHAVKDFVLSCLSNLETLDNQTLVILYSYSLLNAYESTFKERIPEIQQFLTKIFRQIIKKSSKAIFSKLQTLFFTKTKNKNAVKFIEEMAEKMIEQNNKVFRAGYLLSTIRGKSLSTSQKILRKMINQKIQLEHENNIWNTINFILSYPQKSIWNLEQLQKTKIIDIPQLKQSGKIKQIMNSYIILSSKQIHQYLLHSIRSMLKDGSVEMVKTGFNILNTVIKASAQLIMLQENSDFIVQLLKLWLNMLNQKKQLQLDFETGNKTIGYLLCSSILPPQHFQKFLITILQNLESNKKSCDLLFQILNSPCNYIKISDKLFETFVRKILSFENNSPIYKYLLQILSTFFRYRLIPFEKLNQLEKQNKNKRALLLQAYLLAQNAELKPQIVKQVLKISLKDRKIIWARQMMLIRGQRQYFDRQQVYEVWREIKSLSNPYHYHA